MEPRFNTWTTVFENGWVIQIVKKGVGGYLDEVKGKASKGISRIWRKLTDLRDVDEVRQEMGEFVA